MSYDVLLVGSGHVATHLAEALRHAGYSFAITGRNEHTVKELSDRFQIDVYTLDELPNDFPIAILAVRDDQIAVAGKAVAGKCKAIVHTSGTVPSVVLSTMAEQYGVFYPLQTFRKDIDTAWQSIPICIYGSTEQLKTQLHEMATRFTPLVYVINDEQRAHLHVAAVIVNNFVNHLSAKAAEYCKEHQVDFSILHPLIRETAERIISSNDIEALQTGPAIRGDMAVVHEHVNMLMESGKDTLAEMYMVISRSILHTIT